MKLNLIKLLKMKILRDKGFTNELITECIPEMDKICTSKQKQAKLGCHFLGVGNKWEKYHLYKDFCLILLTQVCLSSIHLYTVL